MEEKYIDLLLKKCVKIDTTNSLFINYDIINQNLIDKLVVMAKELGVKEIYLDKNDIYEEHNILKHITLSEIDNHPYFNRSIWNEYALKNSSFLIFRSPIPNLMNDIDSEKLARAEYIRRTTSHIYKKIQLKYQIPWCIAALPNKLWAEDIFKDKENSYELLEKAIYKACMVDTKNPMESWNEQLNKNKIMLEKLNHLKIKTLHYKNKLGTDLRVELVDDSIWCDASTNGLANMPSYEIFTSPHYKKTNGIVYSSKPLIYNGGVIKDFWIKFKNGKVVNFDAREGKDVLESIVYTDENSCYLGECALVENNSPISNTNITFGLTLFDENASCHLALGQGFTKCIKKKENITNEELLEKGLNISKVHVDFMIGTPDLEITAETYDGKKIKILENGNFK